MLAGITVWLDTSRNLPAHFHQFSSCTTHTLIYQRKTNHYRVLLAILFLNHWAKLHFTIILWILLKIPSIWHAIVAANCVEGRQYLLKVVWGLGHREQLGTFVTGKLLTQNDEEKKILTGMKNREKNHRPQSWVGGSGGIKTALAFENRFLCRPVTR